MMPVSPYPYMGYKKIAYLEPYSNKVFVGYLNFMKMLQCSIIAARCGIAMKKGEKKACEEYKRAFKEMTSIEFWERYLDIDNK